MVSPSVEIGLDEGRLKTKFEAVMLLLGQVIKRSLLKTISQ